MSDQHAHAQGPLLLSFLLLSPFLLCRGPGPGALVLGSPTRALNELVSEERERVIEVLAALTASSDLVEQQRCQISDLKDALQARVSGPGPVTACPLGLHCFASNWRLLNIQHASWTLHSYVSDLAFGCRLPLRPAVLCQRLT